MVNTYDSLKQRVEDLTQLVSKLESRIELHSVILTGLKVIIEDETRRIQKGNLDSYGKDTTTKKESKKSILDILSLD